MMTSRLSPTTVGTRRSRLERSRTSKADQGVFRDDRGGVKASASGTARNVGGARSLSRDDLTPRLERTFRGHGGAVTAVSFSPDMKRLVSSCADKSLMLWSSRPQLRAIRLKGHLGPVHHAEFSPDGTLVASASGDRTVRLWNPSALGGSTVLKGHMGGVRHASFSRNGRLLITASEDKTVKIWSVPSQKFTCTLMGRNNTGHNNWVKCATFSPDARVAVSCGEDKTVRLWDVESQEALYTFFDHSGAVTQARFHPDGTCLAACSVDTSVKVWDARSHQLLQHYPAHNSEVTSISFHSSGNFLLSSSLDATVKVWDLREGRLLFTLRGHDNPVTSCCFSNDGSRWASGGSDGLVMSWRSNLEANFRGVAGSAADGSSSASVASKTRGRALSSGGLGSRGVRTALSPRAANARRVGSQATPVKPGPRSYAGTTSISVGRGLGDRFAHRAPPDVGGGADLSSLLPVNTGSSGLGTENSAAVGGRRKPESSSTMFLRDDAHHRTRPRARQASSDCAGEELYTADELAGSRSIAAVAAAAPAATAGGLAPSRYRATAPMAISSTRGRDLTLAGAPTLHYDVEEEEGRYASGADPRAVGSTRASASSACGAGRRLTEDGEFDKEEASAHTAPAAPTASAAGHVHGIGGQPSSYVSSQRLHAAGRTWTTAPGAGVQTSVRTRNGGPEVDQTGALRRRSPARSVAGDRGDVGVGIGRVAGPPSGDSGREAVGVGGGERKAGINGSVRGEGAAVDRRELPEALATTLDHIVGQLDMLVRAVGVLEKRQTLTEDRLSRYGWT